MATKFQTQFSHGKVEPVKCLSPSVTEEQFEYELNINNIVKGQVQSCLPSQTSQAMFGLTITGNEFETQLNATQEVLNYFEELPVCAKEFFEYKPSKMLDFIKNDDNFEKAYEIGLIDKSSYIARKDAFKLKQAELLEKEQQTAPVVTPEASGVTQPTGE